MVSAIVVPIMLTGIMLNVTMLIVVVPVYFLLIISWVNIMKYLRKVTRFVLIFAFFEKLGTYPKPSVTKGMKLFLSGTYLTTENRFTEKDMIWLQMASHF